MARLLLFCENPTGSSARVIVRPAVHADHGTLDVGSWRDPPVAKALFYMAV
jgi:hypothetical protein